MIPGIVAGAAVSGGGGLIGFDERIIASAPVWFCRHNESSGTTAVNEMGAGDGTYTGTPVFGAAAIYTGGATCWDTNSASHVVLPASLLPDPTDEFSLGILLKRKDNSGLQALIDRDPESGARWWQWRFDTTTMQFIKITGGVTISDVIGAATTGDVVLMIVTVNTGQARQYKNGALEVTTTVSAADYGDDMVGMQIGRRIQGDSQANYYCAASMVWQRQVTGTEILKFAQEAGLA